MVLANFREAAAFLVYKLNFTHDAKNREIECGAKHSNSRLTPLRSEIRIRNSIPHREEREEHSLLLYHQVGTHARVSRLLHDLPFGRPIRGVRKTISRTLIIKAMTELIKIQNTMSSHQIAELTGKLHQHVMRDIRNLISGLSAQSTSGSGNYSSYVIEEDTYKDANGNDRACYNLNKKACLLLASGYNVLLRAKIIDRWEELETEKRMQDLPSYQISSPRERAMKWIEEEEIRQQLALENKQQAERIEQQAEQIKEDAPKVLFAKAVETSQRSCLVAELAKILQQNGVQIGQNRLFKWLRAKGYLGKAGPYYNQPTQRSMEKGLFEIKQQTINKPDGSIIVTTTTKVTGRGQIYFVDYFLNRKEEVDVAV